MGEGIGRIKKAIRATVAKEVGMGNPAEKNDPQPESGVIVN